MGRMIEDLKNAKAFPNRPKSISILQTHISIVFVADEFVYKIKKPIDFGFLDFSTLEKRRYYCNQEVLLNRRLSDDIYLDVIPVIFDGKKHALLKSNAINSNSADIVEYAVKMRRIPDEVLMKSLFKSKGLSTQHLEKLAKVLSKFHLNTERSDEIDYYGKPENVKINTDENFEQVAKYVGRSILETEFNSIKEWTNNFYRKNGHLFYNRIKEGRIGDCHGDLHMEHICFTEKLSIIDCIEFNERFRYSDSVADVAFLLMDLEFHGGEKFSDILWGLYKDFAGEKNVDQLLTFYKVYRAFVRGKVHSFQLDDNAIGSEKKEEVVQIAREYFQLAYSYIG